MRGIDLRLGVITSISTTTATTAIARPAVCDVGAIAGARPAVRSGIGCEVVARPAAGIVVTTSVELGGVADTALHTPLGFVDRSAGAFVCVHDCIITSFSSGSNQKISVGFCVKLIGDQDTALQLLVQFCHSQDVELHDSALAGDQCIAHRYYYTIVEFFR